MTQTGILPQLIKLNSEPPSNPLEGATSSNYISIHFYESPYGRYSSSDINKILLAEEILAAESKMGSPFTERFKSDINNIINEDERLSTLLIKLEVSQESRGAYIDLVPHLSRLEFLIEDMKNLVSNKHINAPDILRLIDNLDSIREHVRSWEGANLALIPPKKEEGRLVPIEKRSND